MWPIATDVSVCVYLSVCWAHRWFLPKMLNRFEMRFEELTLRGPKESCIIRWGSRSPHVKGQILEIGQPIIEKHWGSLLLCICNTKNHSISNVSMQRKGSFNYQQWQDMHCSLLSKFFNHLFSFGPHAVGLPAICKHMIHRYSNCFIFWQCVCDL